VRERRTGMSNARYDVDGHVAWGPHIVTERSKVGRALWRSPLLRIPTPTPASHLQLNWAVKPVTLFSTFSSQLIKSGFAIYQAFAH